MCALQSPSIVLAAHYRFLCDGKVLKIEVLLKHSCCVLFAVPGATHMIEETITAD